eukprot:g4610.t1
MKIELNEFPLIGLTERDAAAILASTVEDVIVEGRNARSKRFLGKLYYFIREQQPEFPFVVLCGLVLLFQGFFFHDENSGNETNQIIEGILLLLLSAMHLGIGLRQQQFEDEELLWRLEHAIGDFRDSEEEARHDFACGLDEKAEEKPFSTVPVNEETTNFQPSDNSIGVESKLVANDSTFTSARRTLPTGKSQKFKRRKHTVSQRQLPAPQLPFTVATFRDSHWRHVPESLLVKGDLIAVPKSELPPGRASIIERSSRVKPGPAHLDTVAPYNQYILTETPIRKLLTASLNVKSTDRATVFRRKLWIFQRFQRVLMYTGTIMSIVLSLARWSFHDATMSDDLRTDSASAVLVTRPLSVLICMCSLCGPLILLVLDSVTTSIVLAHTDAFLAFRRGETLNNSSESGVPLDGEETWSWNKGLMMALSLMFRHILMSVGVSKFWTRWTLASLPPDARPYPLGLIDKLGSITVLCCADIEAVRDRTPLVEEVCIKKENSSYTYGKGAVDDGRYTILDLHPDPESSNKVKFESIQWRRHLSSLKPLGISCMLHAESVQPRRTKDFTDLVFVNGVSPPRQRAMASLAREMGFVGTDVDSFRILQNFHLMADAKEASFLTNGISIDNNEDKKIKEELRNLRSIHLTGCGLIAMSEPMLSFKVMEDCRKLGSIQLMSAGSPVTLLPHCSYFWDGECICPMSRKGRRALQSMCQRWSQEDLDAVAFGFMPVPTSECKLFQLFSGERKRNKPDVNAKLASRKRGGSFRMSADAEKSPEQQHLHAASFYYSVKNILPRHRSAKESKDENADSSEGKNLFRCIKKNLRFSQLEEKEKILWLHSLYKKFQPDLLSREKEILNAWKGKEDDLYTSLRVKYGPKLDSVNNLEKPDDEEKTTASNKAITTVNLSALSSPEVGLRKLVGENNGLIFLGMIATRLQPKVGVQKVIEDMTSAGVRFVVFSEKNFRRSKPFAAKMGLDTGWNTAISLSEKASDVASQTGKDGRAIHLSDSTMKGSDRWDAKARLPHGIAAIRKHLNDVDNVPLLVSLFTDSTASRVRQMLEIMSENGEVVGALGSSMFASNAAVLQCANLAIAVDDDPELLEVGPTQPSRRELRLNSSLCSLGSEIRIGSTRSMSSIVQLVKEGRRMLHNSRQALIFGFGAQTSAGLVILLGQGFSMPLILTPVCCIWLNCVPLPLLLFPMAFSPAEHCAMSKERVPLKTVKPNEVVLHEKLLIVLRFFARVLPSVAWTIIVFIWVLAELSPEENDVVVKSILWGDSLPSLRKSEAGQGIEGNRATKQARMMALFSLVWSLVANSMTLLYRVQSIVKAPPWLNSGWVACAFLVLFIQFFFSYMYLSEFKESIGLFGFPKSLPTTLWFVLWVWPLFVVALGESIKYFEAKQFKRLMNELRLVFDTRLGAWSPT